MNSNDRTLYLRAFLGLYLRDLRVLRRELVPFLLRVGMQPLLFVFVFTYVFPHMSGGSPMTSSMGTEANFSTILLPGLMAAAIMFSGIAAIALPLATEFGVTREIDDRVMSPLPIEWVAIEKICFSAMQSILAALVVFPLAYYIPATPVAAHVNNWFFAVLIVVLSSLVAGTLGLAIGATVKPHQIGLVFSIVLMPITFLGCVYYPWSALKGIPALQWPILINPIVYMSEGMRSAFTPGVPHMPWWAILLALFVSLYVLGRIGLAGFRRRVIS